MAFGQNTNWIISVVVPPGQQLGAGGVGGLDAVIEHRVHLDLAG
jgi:hypothetical protein